MWRETSSFPRAGASFLASPQEMSSSCFSFLNLPPLPSLLSSWAPVTPFTGQPPGHARFLLEKITVKREVSRDWVAEKQREPSLLPQACSLDLSALVWGRTTRCTDTGKRVFLSQVTPSPPSVPHLPIPHSWLAPHLWRTSNQISFIYLSFPKHIFKAWV